MSQPNQPLFSDEEILDSAFEYFRKTGFPYRRLPKHVCMQELNKLSLLPAEKLMTSNLCYQVADTYHQSRFHTPANGMMSPAEGFESDKVLKRALERRLKFGSGLGTELLGGVGGIAITSGVQGASNFRPAFACAVYKEFCSAGFNVLDTSAGFGGRILGFAAANLNGSYTGVDPNPTVVKDSRRMISDLNLKNISLINSPIEDLAPSAFAGEFDFALTSPPYFSKELYKGDDQSWKRYSTGELWREGFLLPMLRFQHTALKNGSVSVIVIADVKVKNKIYPLVEWTLEDASRVGFKKVEIREMKLNKRLGKGHEGTEIASETMLVLKKTDER